MNTPFIKELRTGKVKQMGDKRAEDPLDREWESAIFKEERTGKVWLTKTGLEQDEVADTKVHGGPEKALFAYPIQHYAYWQQRLQKNSMVAGGMGENLVIDGVDEFMTFIGDIYRFGGAIIEVSQPRRPCWKPARRHRVLDLALQIQDTGRTGWYYRVLEEGYVEANVTLELIERPHPEWSIAAANEVMYVDKDNLRRAYELASCTALAPNWTESLERRLRGRESSIERRVYGPNKD